MSGLRDLVFMTLANDLEMQSFGINGETLYPNFSPDSPPGQRFAVIRWGTTDRGIGSARRIDMALWVYNREPDFGPITDTLKRARQLVSTLEGKPTGDGNWVIGVDGPEDGSDSFDDIYRAVVRNSSWQIAASGI